MFIVANEVSIDSLDNAPSGRPNIKVKTKYYACFYSANTDILK